MTNLKTKLAAGITTAAILASAIAPAATFAATNTISSNGAGSVNKIKVMDKKKVKVSQSNTTVVANLTGVFQNTGGNSANGNTGDGDVSVSSGNAGAVVSNTTTTRGNTASVDPCGCPSGDSDNEISDNGAGSTNKIKVKSTSKMIVNQTNTTVVVNGTFIAQNTGDNHANNNTGDGSVDVGSGDAGAQVTNTTTTGGNTF